MTDSLRETLNLPRTDFPMKANLPQAEPRRLEQWKAADLYGQVRRARHGQPSFVLHDGPPYANGHIHLGTVLNKILKDVIVRSRSMTGKDAPYRPGWDCHGLPIELKVEKDLGAKKREMSPLAFRDACRRYAEKFVGIQRTEFERLGVLGEWGDPYLTMSPFYQATIVRQLADFAEKGLVYKAKKSVHWCISCRTALAEAEVEYDERHVSPQVDVRFPLADAERDRLAAQHPALAGKRVSAVIWTTTPWTLPANLALAFHPEFEYGFYPVQGTDEVLLLAKGLREASEARWHAKTNPAGAPPPLGAPLAEVKGLELEKVRFRHPWIDRDSPGVLADYVTLDTGTGVVHTAPGHGWDDYLTGLRYGLDVYCPVDEAGRFLPEVERFAGERVFDANPKIVEFMRERGILLAAGKDTHSYPVCWRCKNPIIFRATFQWFIALDEGKPTLREQALAAIAASRWMPGVGRGAHPQHDRDPPRLVHLPPAPVGRADPGVLLQVLRRDPPAGRPRAPRRRRLREGHAPTRGTRATRRSCCPRASPARGAAARRSTRRRTSSTSGSTPARRTRPSSGTARTCRGRPTSTSRAPTSTAAGSTRPC